MEGLSVVVCDIIILKGVGHELIGRKVPQVSVHHQAGAFVIETTIPITYWYLHSVASQCDFRQSYWEVVHREAKFWFQLELSNDPK